jgi:hypothetical protein
MARNILGNPYADDTGSGDDESTHKPDRAPGIEPVGEPVAGPAGDAGAATAASDGPDPGAG